MLPVILVATVAMCWHRLHAAGRRAAIVTMKMKRAPNLQAADNTDVTASIQDILDDERCNVCLTHVNADFDSLAGACALAKLWSIQRPGLPTHVVVPRGVNPLVSRFLAYHKHLLPIRGFKTIREQDVVAVGVVDTQSNDRLGPAGSWVRAAEHVVVVDHHPTTGDIEPDESIIEPVGSATTILVERIRRLVEAQQAEVGGAHLLVTETDATLYALGIRADTGALSFPTTTARDAHALAWLMEHGCSQSAIAEFGQARLSNHQRELLSQAMQRMELNRHEGLKFGSVLLDTGRGFVTGMASVCEELVQLLGCDVLVLGVVHTNAKAQPFLSLIGRCSARAERSAIDLNEVLAHWQGGGHPAAAAASIKLRGPDAGDPAAAEVGAQLDAEAEEAARAAALSKGAMGQARAFLEQAVAMAVEQLPEQVCARELMTTTIHSCSANDTMDSALALMNRMRKRAMPVIGDDDKLLGFLKYRDPIRAAQAGKGQQQVKAWARRELITVSPDTKFTTMEGLLLEGDTGRLHVVDEDGRLLGLVSRTDMLRHFRHYKEMSRRVSGRPD
eukprot:Transcript_9868.p1 GENE.Transcript_9868~~Transcript_9868.p1  ORF type:complete len:560 (+),score=122.29 Transcript_9868:98-1777(+)